MIIQQNSFPQAILFDMDGVLIESQHAWWKAVNVALRCSNHPMITKKEFIDNLWGKDFKQTINYLGIKANVFLDCDKWPPEYLKHIILKNEVVSTLTVLQKTCKLAVITNTQRFITKQVLAKFQLTSFFNAVVCADDVRNGKPAPDIIYHACEKLDVSIADVIVIGDTKSDLLACQRAGCQIIGMNLKNNDYIINHLSEIPKIIEQLKKE